MKYLSLPLENELRIHIQHPRISLTELNGKENILSSMSHISVNMATFA